MIQKIYYFIKPVLPRRFQIFLRRKRVKQQRKIYQNVWPIKNDTIRPPKNWRGWPDGKKFALVLTHDVETEKGQKRCAAVMYLEKELGFRSSFNFVPERYEDDPQLRNLLEKNGFEVGVHGLNHDGKLYSSKKEFLKRSKRINRYLNQWGSKGFRSPAMHHDFEWLMHLNIHYDLSSFDTDPFEPQSDGVDTIYPFFVSFNNNGVGYVELPYTLPQDFTLFVLMEEKDINIWKQKLDWIVKHGGMALLNVHPDYLYFGNDRPDMEEFPMTFYRDFLIYIKNNYKDQYWHVLPKEMSAFWKENYSSFKKGK